MVERHRLSKRIEEGGNYFSRPKDKLEFIPSGCKVLDLALGGGWAEGRIANIVGDKSTGKTLLCIEACANFAQKYPKGKIMYREAEAAFDKDYARALGMPVERIDFGVDPLETVEDLFDDISNRVAKAKQPTLYICDSLDALSDRAEMGREFDEGTYGAEKAKKMSQLFRRLVRKMAETKFTLVIVSQVRDNIGALMMQKKYKRTGGRALDFYATQVVYLAALGTVDRQVAKIKRSVGIKIKAKCEKNKISLPFREALFEITFGYGIDDTKACRDWLKEAGAGHQQDDTTSRSQLRQLVEKRWYEIERSFLPTKAKYG